MIRLSFVSVLMAASISFGMAWPAVAAGNEGAKALFKRMSDYLVSQKTISFTYDSNLEIVSSELQKLRFASSGTLTLSRPDKLRMSRTGGFADVEMTFDGNTLSAMGRRLNIYAQAPTKGTIDELIDILRFDYGLLLPAADLLSTTPYEMLLSNVTDVKDLGSGFIDGKECDHLAFRTKETDWEIWINQSETMPYPCQFSITSKLIAQAPSYTIEIKDWKTGGAVSADDFKPKLGDAKKVEFSELPALNEVPAELEQGEAQ